MRNREKNIQIYIYIYTHKRFVSTQHLDNHMHALSQVTKTEARQVSARERV